MDEAELTAKLTDNGFFIILTEGEKPVPVFTKDGDAENQITAAELLALCEEKGYTIAEDLSYIALK